MIPYAIYFMVFVGKRAEKKLIMTLLEMMDMRVNNCVKFDSGFGNPAFGHACNLTIISRSEWGAAPPNDHDHMTTPVTVAIIHHTDRQHCTTKDECIAELKDMQSFHMANKSHPDIQYNFMVGEDGNVYEGRGWNTVGGHMPYWGIVSEGIAVMGNFEHAPPNQAALSALQELLDCAVEDNKLTSDYKIYGARDIPSHHTNSPGTKFYEVLKTWSHYDAGNPVKPTKTHS